MDKIVAFSNQTGIIILQKDGRDKFTKAVQDGSRLLACAISGKNKDIEIRLRNLLCKK